MLAVVRALLATPLNNVRPAKTIVSATLLGGEAPAREIEVPFGTTTSMNLDVGTMNVVVKSTDARLLAQIRGRSVAGGIWAPTRRRSFEPGKRSWVVIVRSTSASMRDRMS